MIKKMLIGLLILVPVAFANPSAEPKVHEFMLDNGLKILVKEDRRAPVAVSQVWYKVGSSYEPSGMTGISHLLEHMMFKGTPEVGPGEFSRIIAVNGGDENAFTGQDYTAYYQALEKSRLEISFRLEADRMQHLLLNEMEIAKETQVVMEERRLRTDDSPTSLTSERFNAVAYLSSPYRNPVIGWVDDIESIRPQDLRRWYQYWYAPNNATLVVVGDVQPQQVLTLAKKYFGTVPKGAETPVRSTQEVPQTGERRIIVKLPAELPYVLLGYKVPALTTATQRWEPYALEVLAGVLDKGKGARLNRELIRGERVAASVWVDYGMTSRLQELFRLGGYPAPERNATELEQALRGQVARLREQLVAPDELERVVAQIIAEDVYERDSMFYQAMRLGMLETVGLGWNALDDYIERIKAVTAEQVRDVARRYLIDDCLTVAILEPLPLNTVADDKLSADSN